MNPQRPSKSSSTPVAFKYLIGLIVLAVLFLIGFIPKMKNNQKLQADAAEVTTGELEVEVASPRMASADALVLPGNVQAISETSVQARTSGYITKMYVDIGSHVKAGQILADVQSPEVDQQALQANADTTKSVATVGQSQADVARMQAGVVQVQADVSHQKAGVVQAQAALQGAHARRAQAQAGLLQSKAKLLQSKQQVQVQKAALNQAEAQFALSTANEKRYAELLSKGFVSQQDYDQAEASFKTTSATIDSAKANIAASEADVTAAEQVVTSNEALVQSSISDEKAAEANIVAAKANVDSSTANLGAARSSVDASRKTVQANQAAVGSSYANQRRYQVLRSFDHVVAPFEGIITSRNVDVGSLVSPGQIGVSDASSTTPTTGLFGIARVDKLRIFVNLPQTNYQWARDGASAKIHIRELPGQTFTGFVHQSAGALDSTTRTLLTEIQLPNPGGKLLPGMYAQIEFAGTDDKKLRIPANVLAVDAKGTWVVEVGPDGKIHHQAVVLGRDYGTEAEVVSGVKEGDKLVTNPTDDLLDGQTVKVTKETTKP